MYKNSQFLIVGMAAYIISECTSRRSFGFTPLNENPATSVALSHPSDGVTAPASPPHPPAPTSA